MYFKKLELFGFKSFADRTVLNFEPGITAVVGPNGCGKSNIFDSIRWVLGEQSAKDLRGSSMEDVIFNGTEKKSSLGFAEVNLTFSNTSRMLSLDEDEVTITRRLFRSGESEYLLNKNPVRLKDIQEMLMGTGIGAEAYSMIQQGRVDLVVNAKPEDRRQILDEASGITKYKAKKKEALNKLKDTENNLLRLSDIITEVKRQIGSIERQANKARKYKEEFERLKGLEIQLARYQKEKFEQEKAQIQSQLDALREQETNLTKEIEDLSNLLTNEINYLEEIEQKINDVRSEEIKLEGQLDLNNRQIGFNQERVESLRQNEQKIKQQKEQLIERCRLQQGKIEELKQNISTLEETMLFNQQTTSEKKDSLKILERQIEEAKSKIKDHEEKILMLTSQQVNVRNELTDIMKEVQGCLARRRRLDMENEKVRTEKAVVDQKIQSVDYQISVLQTTIKDLEIEKGNQDQVLQDIKFSLNRLEAKIDDLEKHILSLRSQKEFIEKLNVQYQDIPDPVVTGRLITSTAPLDHHTGIIGKVKEVKPVDSTSEILYEISCETKFIELDPQQISNKIEELVLEVNQLIAQKDELSGRLDLQSRSLVDLDEQIHEKEKSLSVLESQRNDVRDEEKKLHGELELVDVELLEVEESLTTLKKKEDEFNYKLDTLNQDISWCQHDIKDKQGWITSKINEQQELSVTIAQLETEMESEKDKLKSLQDNLVLFCETLDHWLEEIKKIDDEVNDQNSKIVQYENEMIELTNRIEKIKVSQGSIKSALIEYESQKSDLGNRINSVRAQITSLEDSADKIKQDLHAQEMLEQQVGFNEKTMHDRFSQTYKLDLEEILRNAESSVSQEPLNWDQLSQEIDVLRKKCDAFGSVNLVAIEEYEELKQRFEFLTQQQSDLIEAKSQLMSTITKINKSTRQMFMDTFTKVSEEFRIYFRMLFGGGEAQLVLLDPENVLESGIEIIARPPGKKLQSISLLSGGEKTLTAIALIFGVFKVNPSPFCVLDEIDAALDESNVGRFSYLLKDFSKIAQFIVITHNKKTIASSDVMYGITMPETGVSRIVSVKFKEDEKNKTQEEVTAGV